MNTMKTDLTWIADGFYTTFLVNSEFGRLAYNEIVKCCGAPKVLNQHRDSTIHQLKQAGYIVRKSPVKIVGLKSFSKADLALLDSLEC